MRTLLCFSIMLLFAGLSPINAQPVNLRTSPVSLGDALLPDAPDIQRVQAVPPTPLGKAKPYIFNCPGSFPSDLTVINCRYTKTQRWEQFVTTGVSDGPIILSALGGTFSQSIGTPSEWPKNWTYYGYRVGSSYTASVGRSAAEYIVSSMLHTDPRHVKCSEDPNLFGIKRTPIDGEQYTCSLWARVRHFGLEIFTVRNSTSGVENLDQEAYEHLDPTTRTEYKARFKKAYGRQPAVERLVGIYAGAYAQYPWEARPENTFAATSARAAIAFVPTVLGSFYTEFGSSILGGRKHVSRTPQYALMPAAAERNQR